MFNALLKNRQNRTIFLSDKLPKNGAGTLLHYNHEPVKKKGWITRDVRKFVRKNEDTWLSDIEYWHRRLSEYALKQSRWWWGLEASRLIIWNTTKSFSLKPLLYSLGVVELIKNYDSEFVHIIDVPDEVAAYLTDWSGSNEYFSVVDNRKNKNWQRYKKISNSLDNFRSFYYFFRQLAALLIQVTIQKKKQIKHASIIINSSVVSSNTIEEVGDHYFGHMFDAIEGLSSDKILWLYNDKNYDSAHTRANFTKLEKNIHFVADFFYWSDLWFALWNSLKIHWAFRNLDRDYPPFQSTNYSSSRFPQNFIAHLCGRKFPFFELMLYRQFGRIIKKSGAHTLFYPYEEKPIERMMLLATQDFAPHVKTIGFAHGSYSKGFLYVRRGQIGNPPNPDFIATTGPLSLLNFKNAGVPPKQLVILGSPRYRESATKVISSSLGSRKKLLLLIGLGFELKSFAAFIEENPVLLDDYELVVRTNERNNLYEQFIAIARMKSAGLKFEYGSSELIKQIDQSDIILFESTTAALQASLRGKLIIQLSLDEIIRSNHFFKTSGQDSIKYCGNIAELSKYLEFVLALPSDEYNEITLRQRELVEELYKPIDQATLIKLITQQPNR